MTSLFHRMKIHRRSDDSDLLRRVGLRYRMVIPRGATLGIDYDGDIYMSRDKDGLDLSGYKANWIVYLGTPGRLWHKSPAELRLILKSRGWL